MPFTREAIRAAIERAGDAHWRALIAHHEEQYPASPPTPGDVCRAEAERLNALGLSAPTAFELVETRVVRRGAQVELTHVLRYVPTGARLWTEPYQNYGP